MSDSSDKKSDQPSKRRTKVDKTPQEAVEEGRQQIEMGDYREAVRQLFLAVLLTLDEQGALRFDTTLTNRELLSQALIRPSLFPALSPVVSTYERVWYGFESLATAEYDALVTQIDQLKQA